jgi:hypothetical protein
MFLQQNSNLGKHYGIDYGVIVNNLWDTLGTWGHMVDIDAPSKACHKVLK